MKNYCFAHFDLSFIVFIEIFFLGISVPQSWQRTMLYSECPDIKISYAHYCPKIVPEMQKFSDACAFFLNCFFLHIVFALFVRVFAYFCMFLQIFSFFSFYFLHVFARFLCKFWVQFFRFNVLSEILFYLFATLASVTVDFIILWTKSKLNFNLFEALFKCQYCNLRAPCTSAGKYFEKICLVPEDFLSHLTN